MGTVQRGKAAEFLEVIKDRRSMRSFRPDPVPKEVLQQVLEAAIRAPSWSNTQPWEFTVVGGKLLERLKGVLFEKASAGVPPNPDIPFPTFQDPCLQRSRENGKKFFETLGITREDKARRMEFSLSMSKFFGAPNGIIVYIDRELGPYSILDAGIAIQNLLLAAHCIGLGACPEAAVVTYPDVLREMLGIPVSKKIICGVAIGYPDEAAPINKHRSPRDPLDVFVTWRDVD